MSENSTLLLGMYTLLKFMDRCKIVIYFISVSVCKIELLYLYCIYGDGLFFIFNQKCINLPPGSPFPLITFDIFLLSYLISLLFFVLLFSICLFLSLLFSKITSYRLMSGTKTMSACLLRWSMVRQKRWRHFSPRKVPAL